jgi:hypothetical protein
MRTQKDIDTERVVYIMWLQNELFNLIKHVKDENANKLFTSCYMSNQNELRNLMLKLGIK